MASVHNQYLQHVGPSGLSLRQHHSLVQQGHLDEGRLQLARFAVHLHRDRFRRDNLRRLALGDARPVATGLQQRQLVRGQSDHLDHAVVGGRLVLATGLVPRVGSTAITEIAKKKRN